MGTRERVAAYGGELETGPRTEGGCAVRARLPLAVGR
jgi:signal transduction histidine kinase